VVPNREGPALFVASGGTVPNGAGAVHSHLNLGNEKKERAQTRPCHLKVWEAVLDFLGNLNLKRNTTGRNCAPKSRRRRRDCDGAGWRAAATLQFTFFSMLRGPHRHRPSCLNQETAASGALHKAETPQRLCHRPWKAKFLNARSPSGIGSAKSTGGVEACHILKQCQDAAVHDRRRNQRGGEKKKRACAFRYLDCDGRKPHRQSRVAPQKVFSKFRKVMSEMGFLEVERPCFTLDRPRRRRTRFFLCPARITTDSLRAAAVAPQLFKQILMIARDG